MPEDNDIRVVAVSRPAIPVPRYNGTLGYTMIPAGFPSLAENTHETFDIVAHIVRHPEATFFMRVTGDSMIGAGIFDGDLLVVDRSIPMHIFAPMSANSRKLLLICKTSAIPKI